MNFIAKLFTLLLNAIAVVVFVVIPLIGLLSGLFSTYGLGGVWVTLIGLSIYYLIMVMLFGLVAMQVQNNHLLKRIAKAIESRPSDTPD